MTAEMMSEFHLHRPADVDGGGRLPGPDPPVLRAGRRAPRGARRPRVAGPHGVPGLPRAAGVPRLGPPAPRVRVLGRRVRRGACRRGIPRRHARRPRRPLPAGQRRARRAARVPHRLASPIPPVRRARRRHPLCNLPAVTDTPPGVDLERLRPWFATHVDGATGGELDRVAHLGRALEPHVRDPRRRATSGSCAARRSGTCSRPRTTWPASTRCSPRSRPPRSRSRRRTRSATTSRSTTRPST